MAKFKVGDRVVFFDKTGQDYVFQPDLGEQCLVIDTNTSDRRDIKVRYGFSSFREDFFYSEDFTLVARSKEQSKEGIVMSTVKKLKELAMSADDKLLRKYEVVNECGELTCEGKEVLMDVLFEQNKKAVVDQLKALDAEEKASKKK